MPVPGPVPVDLVVVEVGLASAKQSSISQRASATAASSGRVTGRATSTRRTPARAGPYRPAAGSGRRAGDGRALRGGDQRPVVKLRALGAVGAAQPLPALPRDQGQDLAGAHPVGSQRDDVTVGGGHDTGDAGRFQPAAQSRVAAAALVPGHPGERDAGLPRAADHRRGQLRLGRERDAVADSGGPAAIPVVGPFLLQVRLPVDATGSSVAVITAPSRQTPQGSAIRAGNTINYTVPNRSKSRAVSRVISACRRVGPRRASGGG